MSWIEGTDNVFDALVTLQEAIEDTAAAEPTAVDGMAEFPFWMNCLRSGDFRGQAAGWGYGIHTIVSELHVMRGSLPDNEAELRKYVRPFYRGLWDDPTIGDTVTTVVAVRYTFRSWQYTKGDVHVGIEFEVDVKVDETTSD